MSRHTTTWISHRGYTKDATENTARAFDAAIELGFDHLETDLRTSRDGHIVLCHDPELTRISAEQTKVCHLNRRELEAIRLVSGEPLLFFDEFVEGYGHLNWILDIKPDSAEQTVSALQGWLHHARAEAFLRQRVRFLMWHRQHEERLAKVLQNAFFLANDKACLKAGIAALSGLPGLAVKPNNTYAVPPTLGGMPVLGPTVVKRYHKKNAKVLGYLPESVAQHQQALDAGVDELLTNHAHLYRQLNHGN